MDTSECMLVMRQDIVIPCEELVLPLQLNQCRGGNYSHTDTDLSPPVNTPLSLLHGAIIAASVPVGE